MGIVDDNIRFLGLVLDDPQACKIALLTLAGPR
jgi:hypothetical protein